MKLTKIFWVKCPHCKNRFYVEYLLRHKNLDLLCPFCGKMFKENEANEILE